MEPVADVRARLRKSKRSELAPDRDTLAKLGKFWSRELVCQLGLASKDDLD
jgi:hypothetical protein